MNVLDTIQSHGLNTPNKIAYRCGDQALTYGELALQSDRLAAWLAERAPDRRPLVVYGHKSPLMPVCFLACVKSGHAYCPVDSSVPLSRTEAIVQAVDGAVVLTTEPLALDLDTILSPEELLSVVAEERDYSALPAPVHGDETYYIIFTSGSTGTPKGVQISADCLGHFADWAHTLGDPSLHCSGAVYINQAPFSFDLSVMDLYLALTSGATLWALEKSVQNRARDLFDSLHRSGASVWVSTPSFADMCLADPSFSQELMPDMGLFLFCGETLTNVTADKLLARFPRARVFNTYGPTESTVAVSSVEITPALSAAQSPLPVGTAKPGTRFLIADEAGQPLPADAHGEIIILGDTVSTGYFNNPEQTARAFFTLDSDGQPVRAYRTGDEGWLSADGQLHYGGRIDLQIKLHGYRIEIEDIENNLVKLPEVIAAVVVPNYKDGKVKSLCAFVKSAGPVERSFDASQAIKAGLKQHLPEYMIPKKIVFVNTIPMTVNGKADRKALKELLA